ncbi:TIGR02206 family membrane protein [Nocardioides mangrovicus]|uniref:TIGR02206 family membrane protein n=1 Tax=Nocardioides mangrovicus TaxID=2478913 RepID=A0A3L8P3K7_9ACTN|nr:TIGR02206 family membrane protein [Nocardioides mangrovicus]RLV49119.1 TIGR02206 family membrane protein [Nocardioides mangrovicus]
MRFQAFTFEHYLLIGLCLAGCVVFALLGRAGDRRELRRSMAVATCCFTVPLQVLQLLPGDFGLGTSLPLQVCDLAWMVAAYALWTRRPWACALLCFWALTLVPQAILTPSLQQEFPDPRFFMFWGMHFLPVWAAVYLLAIGQRPDWRTYRLSVLVTAGWAGGVMVLNAVLGTNYGYLNRKPAVHSALDLLGPWPWYVVAEVAIVAGVWALITWPFARRQEPARLAR